MKKQYEKPLIVIELFSCRDVIICSGWGEDPEDPGEIGFNSTGPNDA